MKDQNVQDHDTYWIDDGLSSPDNGGWDEDQNTQEYDPSGNGAFFDNEENNKDQNIQDHDTYWVDDGLSSPDNGGWDEDQNTQEYDPSGNGAFFDNEENNKDQNIQDHDTYWVDDGLSSPDNGGWDEDQNTQEYDPSGNGAFCDNEENNIDSDYYDYDSEEEYLSRIIYDQYRSHDSYINKTTLYMKKLHEDIESYLYPDLYGHLSIKKEVEKLLELIERGKKEKILFGMRDYIYPLGGGRIHSNEMESSIGFLIVRLLTLQEAAQNKDEIDLTSLLLSGIRDIVLTGVHVDRYYLKRLPSDILEKYDSYLSNLKQIVCDSIENNKKDGVIVERDNVFYCVQCPEESVVTPAKFLSNPEFKDLEYGALKIGEGDDVIRIQNGQYCDMKGKLQMTFPISNGKMIVMALSSENASGFGKIMVYMDDKSCEIFSKYCEELEKEPRTSKVIEAAKSFVQTKGSEVSPPLSVLQPENISKLQHSQKAVSKT